MSATGEQLIENLRSLEEQHREAVKANKPTAEIEQQIDEIKKKILSAASSLFNEGKLLKG